MLLIVLVGTFHGMAHAWSTASYSGGKNGRVSQNSRVFGRAHTLVYMTADYSEQTEEEEEVGDTAKPQELWSENMDWREVKRQLQEAQLRRFLKSKSFPRKLPYSECRKWVIACNRWESEQEWKDWIELGEKKNAYIPTRPDEYYGRLGQWKGWDHFLGHVEDTEEETQKEDEGVLGIFD